MSADDFLLCRPHKNGWLVTRETLSQDKHSDAEKAYERAMGPNSLWTDGFFDEFQQASDFVDMLYDTADEGGCPFEYGAEVNEIFYIPLEERAHSM